MGTASTRKIRIIGLYLLPGMVCIVSLIVAYYFLRTEIPSILAIIVIDVCLVIPLFYKIMRSDRNADRPIRDIIDSQSPMRARYFVLVVMVCCAWFFLCFLALRPITIFLREELFYWVPQWFFLGDYLQAPTLYGTNLILISWYLVVVFSIIIPICEEVYFRGYLLPKTDHLGILSPIFNTALFCVYHFWSPWMIPVRFVATLPLFIAVWKKKNIYISIVTHCIVNIVGDVILTYTLLP